MLAQDLTPIHQEEGSRVRYVGTVAWRACGGIRHRDRSRRTCSPGANRHRSSRSARCCGESGRDGPADSRRTRPAQTRVRVGPRHIWRAADGARSQARAVPGRARSGRTAGRPTASGGTRCPGDRRASSRSTGGGRIADGGRPAGRCRRRRPRGSAARVRRRVRIVKGLQP
jgi:hypothetical protein